jgi:hypothetical protein
MRKLWICAMFALLALTRASHALAANGWVILNEWNCVGDDKYLGNSSNPANGSDPEFLPKEKANGGNWVELVVCGDGVNDTVDLNGLTLEWANDDPSSGSLTFVDPDDTGFWDAVPTGVIITIMEPAIDTGEEIEQYGWGDDSDLETDFENGDWHVNILTSDDRFITHNNPFKVDNDNWRMKIYKGMTAYQDWIGESISGWPSGNAISSTEIGKLEEDPSTAVAIGDYDDGENSTFGAPNTWGVSSVQDFSGLRAWFSP